MKKIFFVFLGVLLFAVSCKKEEDKAVTNQNNDKGVREFLSVDPTEAKIQKFITRMDLVREDPNYPGNDEWNYSEDSTVWYLEAAFNYTYSYPTEIHELTVIDSVEFFITLDNNMESNINELTTTFDNLVDSTSAFYNTIEEDDKFLLFENVDKISVNNGILSIKVFIVIAYNGILPNGDWKVYNTGNSAGMCYQYGWPYLDTRTKIIQLCKINYPPAYFNGASSNSSVTSIFIDKDAGNFYKNPCPIPNPYDGNGNWLFYEDYSQNPNNSTTCLSGSRISYYSDNLHALILNRESHFSNINDCIYQDIRWEHSNSCSGAKIQWYEVDLTMSKINDRSDPPVPTFYDKTTN